MPSIMQYIHARECQIAHVNRQSTALLPSRPIVSSKSIASNQSLSSDRARSLIRSATSLLHRSPIAITASMLESNQLLQTSILLDISICGDFALGYAVKEIDSTECFVFRAFSLPGFKLSAECHIFTDLDIDGLESLGIAGPMRVQVDLIQSRGIVFLHAHVSDMVDSGIDTIRRHYLSIVPFIVNPRVDVLQKLNVKNFSFRSYPPYLNFNQPLECFFPLVECLAANQVAQVRLVFNCGDALHTCVLNLCRAHDESTHDESGVRSESHASSCFASNDWLELESSSDESAVHSTFRIEISDQRSLDIEFVLQSLLASPMTDNILIDVAAVHAALCSFELNIDSYDMYTLPSVHPSKYNLLLFAQGISRAAQPHRSLIQSNLQYCSLAAHPHPLTVVASPCLNPTTRNESHGKDDARRSMFMIPILLSVDACSAQPVVHATLIDADLSALRTDRMMSGRNQTNAVSSIVRSTLLRKTYDSFTEQNAHLTSHLQNHNFLVCCNNSALLVGSSLKQLQHRSLPIKITWPGSQQ